MHCPQCGKPHAEKARYCTRCGSLMSSVISLRKTELVQGIILVVVGTVAVPFSEGVFEGATGRKFGEAISSEMLLNVVAAILFLWGLWRIISALRAERRVKHERTANVSLRSADDVALLAPQSESVTNSEMQTAETAKIVQPSTGEITKSLVDDQHQ